MASLWKESYPDFQMTPETPADESQQNFIRLRKQSGKIVVEIKRDSLYLLSERKRQIEHLANKGEGPKDEKENDTNTTADEGGEANGESTEEDVGTNPENTSKGNEEDSGDESSGAKGAELVDQSYTFYDPELNNRFLILVSIFDDKYDDQHRLMMLAEVFLRKQFANSPEVGSPSSLIASQHRPKKKIPISEMARSC